MITAPVTSLAGATGEADTLPQALSAPPSFIDTQSIGLRAQREQFFDSFRFVMEREPTADEIARFERRQLEKAKGG